LQRPRTRTTRDSHQENGQLANAINYGTRAIKIDRQLKNFWHLARLLRNLGEGFRRAGCELATLGVTNIADVILDGDVNSLDVTAFVPNWLSRRQDKAVASDIQVTPKLIVAPISDTIYIGPRNRAFSRTERLGRSGPTDASSMQPCPAL
jgi:hypothetical protein